jgi:antitoxin (DNA-binding transcriptional repressor) of toxin-antitoxin stability system
MEITANQLGIDTSEIMSQMNMGNEIFIMSKGKAFARIVPMDNMKSQEAANQLFGIWKDRKDIDGYNYVRDIRKGRRL